MSRAIALFSGGLDSLLAARLVMDQGVDVLALQFITPFFNYRLKGRETEAAGEFLGKYGFACRITDITEDYVRMLRSPRYGYGKNFNPCIDCKILMMKKARAVMLEEGADFLVSGEVLGQRPMSQRRDALRIVERDSGMDYHLLRPLCAKLLKPTYPEEHGLVDREKLLDISGRSRKRQIELAEQFGISDYQTPAGGCLLTDPIISRRVRKFLETTGTLVADDLTLLSTGRHFTLSGGMLFIGRNRDENMRLAGLARDTDYTLKVKERPGPVALFRGEPAGGDLEAAAGITARYADTGGLEKASISVMKDGRECAVLDAEPARQEFLDEYRTVY